MQFISERGQPQSLYTIHVEIFEVYKICRFRGMPLTTKINPQLLAYLANPTTIVPTSLPWLRKLIICQSKITKR